MTRILNVSLVFCFIKEMMLIVLETSKANLPYIEDTMMANLCFGIPPQCFKMVYDTGTSFVVIGKYNPKQKVFTKEYNKSVSTTSKMAKPIFFTLLYNLKQIQTLESIDSLLTINSTNPFINSFSFLLGYSATIEFNIEGILGLSRYYPEINERDKGFNSRFSLIQSLYDIKAIDRRVFAHKYINETHGRLYLGEVPNDNNNTQYFKCQGNDNTNFVYKWYCQVYTITSSDSHAYTFNLQRDQKVFIYAMIYTGSSIIKMPPIEGEALFSYLFSLNPSKCWHHEEGSYFEYKKLICSKDISIDAYPDLYFHLDSNYKLILFHNSLFAFNTESSNYECIIIIEKNIGNIELGVSVLKNYDMIFNYDDSTVSFSYWNNNNYKEEDKGQSSDSVNNNNNTTIITRRMMLILLINELSIGIIFMSFIYKKQLK